VDALRITDQPVAAIITSSRLPSAYDARLFNLLDPPMTLDDNALAQLFFAARTHNAFADRPVADELLQRLYVTGNYRAFFLRAHRCGQWIPV